MGRDVEPASTYVVCIEISVRVADVLLWLLLDEDVVAIAEDVEAVDVLRAAELLLAICEEDTESLLVTALAGFLLETIALELTTAVSAIVFDVDGVVVVVSADAGEEAESWPEPEVTGAGVVAAADDS